MKSNVIALSISTMLSEYVAKFEKDRNAVDFEKLLELEKRTRITLLKFNQTMIEATRY